MHVLEPKGLEIWCVTDEKPGHVAQTQGLMTALRRLAPVSDRYVRALPPATAIAALVSGRLPALGDYRDHFLADAYRRPVSIVLCCGHATHLTGLALRRALGGRLVVLMRPSLPSCMFDLVVAPVHDGMPETEKVMLTKGVLNPFSATGEHHKDRGLVLIGGASRHYRWDNDSLVHQLRSAVSADPHIRWTLTTSRRTPPDTLRRISSLQLSNLEVVPLELTGAGWVAEQLEVAEMAWITEDSASMVYEALTAGVAVGLLEVPGNHTSRVSRGMEILAASGKVTRFSDWHRGAPLPRSEPLAEADRVAREILHRWFPDRLDGRGPC